MDLLHYNSIFTTLWICSVISTVFSGCTYQKENGLYTCGNHGECKQTQISSLFVLRYCQCDRGYSGEDMCNQQCVDCCEDMMKQCHNKRHTSPCKLPKCLSRILKSRKCPNHSPTREEIVDEIQDYKSICMKPT